MKRQRSAGSGNRSSKRSSESPKAAGKRSGNFAPPSLGVHTESDFGEEIEDQYYKRSVPSNFVLSPKRNSETPHLSIKSPSSQEKDPLMNEELYGFGDDDDIDLDEA